MEANLPFEVVYDTPKPVPLADIIESLRGIERIARESGLVLQALAPGLEVRSISVSVVELSQRSPLREGLSVALVLLYQDKLAKDMPKLLEGLLGVHIPTEYDNILSILLIILMVYSAERLFDFAKEKRSLPKLKIQHEVLRKEFAERAGLTEEFVQQTLEQTINRGRSRILFDSARRVFKPAKNQFNAPMLIGGREVSPEIVAEFPSDAQALEVDDQLSILPLQDAEVFLHAQDLDRNKQGWAAVVPALSLKRVPMQLYPSIQPSDIYTREKIRGDLLVERRPNEEGDMEPVRFHLVRLSGDETTIPQGPLPSIPTPPKPRKKT